MDEPDKTQCKQVNLLNTTEAKCNFTINIEDCSYDGIIYNYTHLAYCDIGDDYQWASVCILLSILFFLFLSMGVVTDKFLCPALITISKTLRMPNNIAGVTFLAFGNGAPDIISAMSGISREKPELIFSGLFGAGIFVTTVVTGSVLLTGKFKIMQRPLIRDIAFYIGSAFMVWFIIWKSRIYLIHAIALIAVYICYITVVIVSRYLYMKTKKGRDSRKTSSFDSTELRTISDNIETFENGIDFQRAKALRTKSKRAESLEDEDVVLTRFYRNGTLRTPQQCRTNSMTKHLAHHHFENTLHAIERQFDETHSFDGSHNNNQNKSEGENLNIFRQLSTICTQSILLVKAMMSESKDFIIHIFPVDIKEWPQYPWYKKAMELIKAIPYFFMTLCIPVVDLESPKENWCRLLSCLNLIFAPQITLFCLSHVDITIGSKFPVWALVLIISFAVALIVYLTSNREEPPFYNRVFAFLGFGVSVIFINAIANEVINILKTLGFMFNLSDAILGLTILAWGNSLGDLIADISMARHGYPGIGISACFGGCLLNLLLGLGLPYTILLFNGHEDGLELTYNDMITLLYTTITISLTSSLILFIFNQFEAKKVHGIYLLCLYFVYITFAILIESKILST